MLNFLIGVFMFLVCICESVTKKDLDEDSFASAAIVGVLTGIFPIFMLIVCIVLKAVEIGRKYDSPE